MLVNELASPRKLAAIDLSDVRIEALDQYIEDRDLSGSVTAHYGVDQSDAGALRDILADQFEGQPLDLVIDDASHQLAPTRASFDVLFPHLRGLGTPMANLVFELTLVCATRPDLIASIELKPEAVAVRRGPEPVDVDDFALRDCFDRRWKQFLTETDYRSFT